MTPKGSIRIGVDAGESFTHAVAVRSADGAVFSALVPSTPANPPQASAQAIQSLLEQAGAPPGEIGVLLHAASATAGAFLTGEDLRLGLLVTAGARHILEVGRQALPPDGIKPPRLAPLERVLEAGGRVGPRGEEIAPLDEDAVREAARRFKELGVEAVGVCLLHAPANPAHERRARAIFSEEFPACHLALSCEAPGPAHEHERALAALAEAAARRHLHRSLGEAAARAAGGTSLLVMKSDGGAMSARRALERPLAAALSGPAAGTLTAAALARAAGLRRVIALGAGGSFSAVSLVEEGAPLVAAAARLGGEALPAPAVDLAAVPAGGSSVAWVDTEKTLRLGPRRAGAGPMCWARGGEEPTLTDALLALGWLPERLAGGALPLDRAKAEEGMARLAQALGGSPEEAAQGALEAALRGVVLAIREGTVRRGKDPREYALLAFGGMGPLLAAPAALRLGIREVVIPPGAGLAGAVGLVEAERRNAYARPHAARLEGAPPEELERLFLEMEREAGADLDAEGVPADSRAFLRAADMRYRGEAWEIAIEFPPGLPFPASLEGALACFHEAYRFQFGFDRRGRAPVETARLRLTATGKLEGPPRQALPPGRGPEGARRGERRAAFAGGAPLALPLYDRERLGPGDRLAGPAAVEDACSTTLIPPGASCEVDAWGNLRILLPPRPREAPDPLLEEVVEGALLAAEEEMEGLFRRAARSRYVGEMGVCRAALFDRRGRKLTGRPIAAQAAPVLENWPREEIREGDLFLWNDAYIAGGGAGRLPELSCCAPVFHGGELAGFALLSGHHEDIGGMAPGGLPPGATQIFQEGLLIPPVKLYEGGLPNETARRIILRNSRRREELLADLEAQAAACRAGASRLAGMFERMGAEAALGAFEALFARCEQAVREELLPRIPDGTCAMEDHVESDGAEPGRVHTLRLKMTKADGRLTLDFRGASPQARGPINWPADRDGGAFLKMWLGPLLRDLAPERAAGGGLNEGLCPLIETLLPEAGTLITPVFPAATGMGALTLQRLRSLLLGALGLATQGQMPADQEPLHWWGLRGRDLSGRFFLFREPLAGGSGARPLRDGEDALLPTPGVQGLCIEAIEARFPLKVERTAWAEDSGGPGRRRGGLGVVREIRPLADCEIVSLSDRALLSPWGANGGRAGGRFSILVNPGTPVEREAPALSGGNWVREGDLIRVATTGGGGWGDPLEREPERAREDVLLGKVSADGAMRHYGVVLNPVTHQVDGPGTRALRQFMRARRGKPPFFDRGPNYAALKR